MTGTELRDLVESSEFKQGLEELSSYLASIMQERPIVHLLAKCLWRRGHKCELEHERKDLHINGKRIEFKFNFDRCEARLSDELAKYGGDLEGMLQLVQAKAIKKSWGVLAKICEDMCIRKPNVFVWIICSCDLSKVAPEDLKRICFGREQREYNCAHPYTPDSTRLPMVDSLLDKLRAMRPFSLLKHDIQTNGDFPSTYHFRICDFGS